ncbi:hypothetical protein [Niastella sp. OAS944]|nr:hypothetical protein [Chitinophagaceae bacterium OAS944]
MDYKLYLQNRLDLNADSDTLPGTIFAYILYETKEAEANADGGEAKC